MTCIHCVRIDTTMSQGQAAAEKGDISESLRNMILLFGESSRARRCCTCFCRSTRSVDALRSGCKSRPITSYLEAGKVLHQRSVDNIYVLYANN